MRANVDGPLPRPAQRGSAQPHRPAELGPGCSLAAVGGILIAPSLSLEAGSLSLLIVNAYAAAIFGRLRSLPLTFVGAIVIGSPRATWPATSRATTATLAGFRPAAAVIISVHRPAARAQPPPAHPQPAAGVLPRPPAHGHGRPGRRGGGRRDRDGHDHGHHQPHHLRPDVPAGHRRPVPRAAGRLRRADLPGPAELRRHRGDRGGPPRRWGLGGRAGAGRGLRRGGGRARGPAGHAPLGHLPGPGHRGVRGGPGPLALHPPGLRRRPRPRQPFRALLDHHRPAVGVRLQPSTAPAPS